MNSRTCERLIAETPADDVAVLTVEMEDPRGYGRIIRAGSGVERIAPLASQPLDNGVAVFASKGGADDNPAWYYNLLANPDVTVEFGSETFQARAYEAEGEEYDRIWSRQKADIPTFAQYEQKTRRPYIPVMVLERV